MRRSLGIDPGKDLKTLVLSHLHHDHADGLSHFHGTDIIVTKENYRASTGLKGALLGTEADRLIAQPSRPEPPAVGQRVAEQGLRKIRSLGKHPSKLQGPDSTGQPAFRPLPRR
jgi:metal-dependent hydrolase (beta-lactamase superfamily II)